MSQQSILVREYIIVNPLLDNVAVIKIGLKPGTALTFTSNIVVINQPMAKGQRLAVRDIACGEPVIQYGCPFGISKGIKAGEAVTIENISNIQSDLAEEISCEPPGTVYSKELMARTFEGYRRPNGAVGTRNYYLVVPTSQCASETAAQIARSAAEKYKVSSRFLNLDGIIAIPNTEGCGCASNVQIDRFLRVLQNFIRHPNVGGVLVIDLGCEQTNYAALTSYIKKNGVSLCVPNDWLTIQKEGGTQKTIEKALDIISRRLPQVNSIPRTACSIEHLVLGTECGASDAFSGITANLAIGSAADMIITGKGSAILSEVPEMVGAEYSLMRRMRNQKVVSRFKEIMGWYQNISEIMGVNMRDNLVPENIAGGLINPTVKSLGAVVKGGTTAIEGVLDYGERLSGRGLNIMQGPGSDIESVTGLAASGANVICFSTGKGTVTGSAIVPVIKISSTTELCERMSDDIDFNAGSLLDANEEVTIDDLGNSLLDLVIQVASGKKTSSERNNQRQFQVWTAGKLSL